MKLTNSPDDFANSLMVVVSIILAGIIVFACGEVQEAFPAEYTDDQIVEAIYHAEGGLKASKPYGIMLNKCSWATPNYCKKACYQTIRNNRERYAQWGHKQFDTYLEFLSSRYAPIGANNDPKGLNKNWLRNVTAILERRASNG